MAVLRNVCDQLVTLLQMRPRPASLPERPDAGSGAAPLQRGTRHSRDAARAHTTGIAGHDAVAAAQVHTASCMLVVVDSVEGPEAAHALAIALVEAAMQSFLADLAAELLRFLDPAGDADRDTFLDPPGAPPGLPRLQSCMSL